MAGSSTVAVCALCDGTKWKPSAADPRRVELCDCVIAARQKYADGVPLEFRDARLENYREEPGNKAAMAAARRFVADAAGDLCLCGGVGSGKTRLACSILNELHQVTRGGLFVRVPKLLLDLQLMFGARTDDARAEERRYCERLFSVPVLVLDDVGVEKASDYTNRTLYTVYEERSDRGLRTVWTSNLLLAPTESQRFHTDRPPTLGEFLGDDRLPSRIAGRGPVVFLNVRDQRLPFRRGRGE